jgi:hypothetical protein
LGAIKVIRGVSGQEAFFYIAEEGAIRILPKGSK